eukprot:CAMPEP_0181362590 /NCGR_PEP_ID=MMETSP1106-20121128/8123_1 /TAXON_ID=81844 /ORGANISM="Mantoniella antarctica, Strain SL-175" /LENGTH=51 /DNA_ID=CAMNT_0023476625 /DNA_START=223 /DNA_END=374 /DNA_ORIENTATION=-
MVYRTHVDKSRPAPCRRSERTPNTTDDDLVKCAYNIIAFYPAAAAAAAAAA